MCPVRDRQLQLAESVDVAAGSVQRWLGTRDLSSHKACQESLVRCDARSWLLGTGAKGKVSNADSRGCCQETDWAPRRDHSVLQWLAAGAGKVSQRRSCDLAAVSKWSWKPRDGCRP